MYFKIAQLMPSLALTANDPAFSALSPEEKANYINQIEIKIAKIPLSEVNRLSQLSQQKIDSLKKSGVYTSQNPPIQYQKLLKNIAKAEIFIDLASKEPGKRSLLSNPTSKQSLVKDYSADFYTTNKNPYIIQKDNIFPTLDPSQKDPTFLNVSESDLKNANGPLSQQTISDIKNIVGNLISDTPIKSIRPKILSLWHTIRFLGTTDAYNNSSNPEYFKYRYAVKWYEAFIKEVISRSDKRKALSVPDTKSPLSNNVTDKLTDEELKFGSSDPYISSIAALSGGSLERFLFVLGVFGTLHLSKSTYKSLNVFATLWKKMGYEEACKNFYKIEIHDKEIAERIKEVSKLNNLVKKAEQNKDAGKTLWSIYNYIKEGNFEALEKIASPEAPEWKALLGWANLLGVGAVIVQLGQLTWLFIRKSRGENISIGMIANQVGDVLSTAQMIPWLQAYEAVINPVLPIVLDALAALKFIYDLLNSGGWKNIVDFINKQVENIGYMGVGDHQEIQQYDNDVNKYYLGNSASEQFNLAPDVSKFITELEGYSILAPYILQNNWKWILNFLRNPEKLNIESNSDLDQLRNKIIKDFPWIMGKSNDVNILNLYQYTKSLSNKDYLDIFNIFKNNKILLAKSSNNKTNFENYFQKDITDIPSDISALISKLQSLNKNDVFAVFLMFKYAGYDVDMQELSAYIHNNLISDKEKFKEFCRFMNLNIERGMLKYKAHL